MSGAPKGVDELAAHLTGLHPWLKDDLEATGSTSYADSWVL